MSQICFYLDEDAIETALIRALRNADLDVITVADAGRLGLPDEEQLMWATEQRRVIYSFNRGDFCRLHRDFMATGIDHCDAARMFNWSADARIAEIGSKQVCRGNDESTGVFEFLHLGQFNT